MSDVLALPAFAALDVRAVMEEERRGASIQVDNEYFRGQELAVDAVETVSSLTERQRIASQSRQVYDQIQIDFDSLTRENLKSASTRYRDLLQQLPEVRYFKQQFSGTCFVIPEWLRTPQRVNYGARIYFFREDDAPAPTDVLDRNIDAVVTGDRGEFEQYQGALHGYPECCIEHFSECERTEEMGPELEAVEPVADHIDTSEISKNGEIPSTSIDTITDGIFESPHVYAFFAREFYPEPDCDQARHRGISIYDTLRDVYPEPVVKDYFRINAGWSYLMAEATTPDTKGSSRPSPGSLGREHLLFHLPLAVTTRLYQNGKKDS
ncbi:hypothetical protein [Halopenitus sp. POP-27]|uniref:hypothetical protein n=1 Tax=Halopenitus sp. POP-27 TaxID=2994425 RepID=UPI002469BC83|nr:hypothetical protein [Halopenitus sp. POP-27]